MTYPDPTVAALLNEFFVPVQLNLSKSGQIAHRYQVIWTPNINIVEQNERLFYHSEGWLPPAAFAAMLHTGRGHFELHRKRYEEAGRIFENVVNVYPESVFAPEALYYLGVCRYMASSDGGQLTSSWQHLQRTYPESHWAMRSKV